MQSEAFLDIGRHCKEPSCNQLDFLPFSCPSCHENFCADHWRPPAGHKCPKYDPAKEDIRIRSCPLCSVPVSFPPGTDPNIVMDAHLSASCPILNPALASKPAAKPANECSARGCKTKMIVPIACDKCGMKHCPKHRFAADHACRGLQARGAGGKTAEKGGAGVQKVFGGLLSKATPSTGQPASSGLAGLAALRRAQQAKSTPRAPPSTTKPVTASAPLGSTANPLVLDSSDGDDSDIQILSSKPAKDAVRSAGGGGKKALASVGIASKTDKRALAEQKSRRKALEARAKKGLLTETEKLQYATMQALAVKNAGTSKGGEGCQLS
ncbi:zinc finger, AN1-type protein [Rhodotorula toruloides]|uniref:Zinc finger, AN1-type protein n=1 Tax=Rhodotorula toruloides TaxID=5286 RepID=A0A511KKY6_RHOTO|nr:zinc finger, AN1-type protein [Rhodotorula toruloides]